MERKQNTNGESQWGISSAGRAPALHAGGQEFESPILHHFIQVELGETHSKEPVGSFLMPLRHAVLLFSSVLANSSYPNID